MREPTNFERLGFECNSASTAGSSGSKISATSTARWPRATQHNTEVGTPKCHFSESGLGPRTPGQQSLLKSEEALVREWSVITYL